MILHHIEKESVQLWPYPNVPLWTDQTWDESNANLHGKFLHLWIEGGELYALWENTSDNSHFIIYVYDLDPDERFVDYEGASWSIWSEHTVPSRYPTTEKEKPEYKNYS